MRGRGRNTDGGPQTHVFAFDLKREYEMAERYTPASLPGLAAARRNLVDEVAAYRRSGRLSPALLAACDDELALSKPDHSVGLRRLCELAGDGHPRAKERVRALLSHPRAEVRAALIWGHAPIAFDRAELMQVARRLLKDRSSEVQVRTASTAVFSDWFELMPAIKDAALAASREKVARELFYSAFNLEQNMRTGHRGGYRSSESTRAEEDSAMSEFLAAWRQRTPKT